VLQLKSAWRDGTMHMKMSPVKIMQRLRIKHRLKENWLKVYNKSGARSSGRNGHQQSRGIPGAQASLGQR
jgi:hypothetical protein